MPASSPLARPLRLVALIALLLCLGAGLSGCINDSTTNPPVSDPTPDSDVGQGGGVTNPPATPPPPSGPTSGLKLIASGAAHNCTIRNGDNSLWCWGENNAGQLGNGSIFDSSSFIRIGSEAWTQVAAGERHSCGILEDKTLWCWGANEAGQLSGGTVPTDEPVRVGSDEDWHRVAVGHDHSCAIKKIPVPDSDPVAYTYPLYCWGDNSQSQLGETSTDADGNPSDKSVVPLRVGSDSDWNSLSLGDQYSCAVKQDKSLWCWGDNTTGQLGLGDTTDRATPSAVQPGIGWLSVAAAAGHSCAIRDDDASLWCWGDNSFGQLGQGSLSAPSPTPLAVRASTEWRAVAVGKGHSCAIEKKPVAGSSPQTYTYPLYCWGNNVAGQLGVGTTIPLASPTQVGSSEAWLTLSAGDDYSCAIDSDYIGYCWGLNASGQLGNGIQLGTDAPRLFDDSDAWAAIDSGTDHSCGLKTDPDSPTLNALWCGGGNSFGQLGIGSLANQAAPVRIKGPAGTLDNWQDVATGHHYSCAVTDGGALYCWGKNKHGQLGRGHTSDNIAGNWSLQTQVSQGADDWDAIAAGASHSCAIKGANRDLYCWGDNSNGQLGDGTTNLSSNPVQVAGSWLDMAIGGVYSDADTSAGGHTCAIKLADPSDTQGSLWCWGKNDLGQLGTSNTTEYHAPRQITAVDPGTRVLDPDFDTRWRHVAAGNNHTCAVNRSAADEDVLYCWGDHSVGQLGVGTEGDATRNLPTLVDPANTWQDVDLGQQFSCGVTTAGILRCWGDNGEGQINAASDQGAFSTPQTIGFNNDWTNATAAKTHGCGIREDAAGNRKVYCWGDGAEYQFGDGNAWKTTPQRLSLE